MRQLVHIILLAWNELRIGLKLLRRLCVCVAYLKWRRTTASEPSGHSGPLYSTSPSNEIPQIRLCIVGFPSFDGLLPVVTEAHQRSDM